MLHCCARLRLPCRSALAMRSRMDIKTQASSTAIQKGQQLQQHQHQHQQQQKRTRPSQGELVEHLLHSWEQQHREAAAAAAAAGSAGNGRQWPHPVIDIGLNLTDSSFNKDRDRVLARAAHAGVVATVVTGTCVRTAAAARCLVDSTINRTSTSNDTSTSNGISNGLGSAGNGSNGRSIASSSGPELYFTAGVHPHNAKGCGPDTLAALRQLAAHPRCVAIGECGLDFNRNFSPPDVQEKWFIAQIELAEELQMPLFLHCRDAYPRFCQLLKEHRSSVPGVAHCFTSSSQQDLEGLLELGLHVGITGWVCDDRPERGGAELAALLPLIPDDRLLIETDAPYLTPRTVAPSSKARPSRNEPALLPAVLQAVAVARGQDPAHVAAITTANARRLFGLQ